jgi:hypothetical protein
VVLKEKSDKPAEKPVTVISHSAANELVKKLGSVSISKPSMPKELKELAKKMLPVI